MFRSPHFLFLITFGDKNTKILRNLCLHFARQDGKEGKNGKKVTQLKLPKYQKTKIWDERNKSGHNLCILTFYAKKIRLIFMCRLIEECGQNSDQKSKSGCLKTFIDK